MLILPMGLIAMYSCYQSRETAIVSFTFTLEHYAKFFTDPDFPDRPVAFPAGSHLRRP